MLWNIQERNNMKIRFMQYLPEISWMSYDSSNPGNSEPTLVREAPAVVYNPVKMKTPNDPISPSACFRVFYGEENWEAVNVYRS